jgi:hypothetical protein
VPGPKACRMPTTEPDPFYVPPAFPLFEFDDTGFLVNTDVRPRRWFPAFNGKLGQAADEMQLGWRHPSSGGQIVVGTPSQVVVDGSSSPSSVTTLGGVMTGYTVAGECLLTFAAAGIEISEIRSRTMDASSGEYFVDPTVPHSTSELEQDWEDFFRDFPQARPGRQ